MRNRDWSSAVKVPRLIFYHVPKTGGLSFYHALDLALYALSHLITLRNPGFHGFKSERIDTPERMQLIENLWFVATHLPYGWHLKYKTVPLYNPITILRDPFERLLSSYTYACMRRSNKPTVAEFLDYSKLQENQNTMVRFFVGAELDRQLDAEKAVRILERDFLTYGTTNNITTLIEGLLNYANLPNVMIEGKVNFTHSEYKLEASGLRPQIESLNKADMELYKEIETHPRHLPIPSGDGYHPYSVLLREVGGSSGCLTHGQSVMSNQLLEVISKASSGEEVFSAFFSSK